jgi:hypothetical protein
MLYSNLPDCTYSLRASLYYIHVARYKCGFQKKKILELFKEQSRAFDEFRNGNPKLITWLAPVVSGLLAISNSAVLSAGASLVS